MTDALRGGVRPAPSNPCVRGRAISLREPVVLNGGGGHEFPLGCLTISNHGALKYICPLLLITSYSLQRHIMATCNSNAEFTNPCPVVCGVVRQSFASRTDRGQVGLRGLRRDLCTERRTEPAGLCGYFSRSYFSQTFFFVDFPWLFTRI